jgi:hypothetical protein
MSHRAAQSNPDLWRGHESDIAFWKKISGMLVLYDGSRTN